MTSPMILIASPGPGKGWRQTIRSGIPSSSPTRRTSSLKSSRSGSTSFIFMSAGSPPTLWWLLIDSATPVLPARLDDIGVERALDEPLDVSPALEAELASASSSKTRMNFLADALALVLRTP